MGAEGLTGSRIRERRMMATLRQADLARQIGISASYLNLIEHNRRRIGGKLLLKIANVLEVEPSLLSEGAEAALIAELREAAAALEVADAELDRIEEFAGRFPGWAEVVATAQRRIASMAQSLDALSDQIAHDPVLAESVHEVLSTAASIRSTANILAETESLEREWLNRFHANINQDSARLAESSRALARYLEQGKDRSGPTVLPQEEADRFLEAHKYHFPVLEADPSDEAIAEVLDAAGLGAFARNIAEQILRRYAQDVRRLAATRLEAQIRAEGGIDPQIISERLRVPLPVVLRRIACLPDFVSGYILADRSGSLLLRKSLPGLDLPRFGASCPYWPVFQALTQPGILIRQEVEQLGVSPVRFVCYAVTEPVGRAQYNQMPLLRAGMLVLPSLKAEAADLAVGATCRLCPREGCRARREPSVLR